MSQNSGEKATTRSGLQLLCWPYDWIQAKVCVVFAGCLMSFAHVIWMAKFADELGSRGVGYALKNSLINHHKPAASISECLMTMCLTCASHQKGAVMRACAHQNEIKEALYAVKIPPPWRLICQSSYLLLLMINCSKHKVVITRKFFLPKKKFKNITGFMDTSSL